MDYDLSFLNKTEILPNINLMGLGRSSARKRGPNSWDCHDDCIYECGNCEEGDYDYNPNCFDCFCDCDDCDYNDCECFCDCDCDY